MNTDVPAAVSPFDACFGNPQEASGDADRIAATQAMDEPDHLLIYDTEDEDAWIQGQSVGLAERQ